MLKKYAIPALLQGKPNESELTVNIVNGTTIRLIGADNPENLRGVGLQGVVLDEFADIKRPVWTTIIRPMLSDTRGWGIFLGTPKGKVNHLYEHFIKDEEHKDPHYRTLENQPILTDSDFKSFLFKTLDNPYIDPEEIAKARKELAPQYFRQEYEASFENYTGVIYKEFDSGTHTVSISQIEKDTGQKFIKEWYKIYIGLDTGRHTAVSFMCTTDTGKRYIFDEIYDYDGTVSVISAQIKNILKKHGIQRYSGIIDSASQVKREYEQNGIHCEDSKKDVENQIEQVRNGFASNTLFFNSDLCPMHIVEHKGYSWDEHSIIPKPKKENDHTCSSVQYILSTYPIKKSTDWEKEKQQKLSIQWLNENMGKVTKLSRTILRNS